jgi:3-hydroxybutyrate dehydrogenase
MKDKTVFITGSTSGIGFGIAKKFATSGCTIIIHGIADGDTIKSALSELKSLGANAYFVAGDLSKPSEIESMFKEIEAISSGVDILINNAGIQFVSPIEDFPNDKWEQIIRIDLIASYYTSKFAIPYMRSKKWGRIINIASAHAHVASPFKTAYVSAKHGILGLTKTLALEVGMDFITVNAIAPGYVETPLVLNQVEATAKARGISKEEVIKNVMLGPHVTKKFVQISEVAGIAFFLCQEDASSITGTSILVDAGWTAQ